MIKRFGTFDESKRARERRNGNALKRFSRQTKHGERDHCTGLDSQESGFEQLEGLQGFERLGLETGELPGIETLEGDPDL